MGPVRKKDFAGVFGRAYLKAFTEDTIKAAFAATGLHPFNPDVIKEKQMKASLPTSTRSSFPLPQPSPVRAIITAMGTHPPTQFELSPTHFALASPREPQIDPALLPETPETPSKRMRLLYGTLATTSSGSLLVSKARLPSNYTPHQPVFETLPPLPQPEWSVLEKTPSSSRAALEAENTMLREQLGYSRDIIRVREAMDQGKNAQLILQHAELRKLKLTR
ncbi:hypothetical protein FIBSPDRAFT_856278, partial [Athelia psychrophila]